MSKPPIIIGVLGLGINEQGKFLVTKRHQPQDLEFHECWQIPGGGMEFGESPEQTLAREMQEELGVSCQILHPLPMAKTFVFTDIKHPFHVTLLCYLVSIGDQTPTLNDPETADWKWLTLDEIAQRKILPLTLDFMEEASKIIHQHKEDHEHG